MQEILESQKPYLKSVDFRNVLKPGKSTERPSFQDLISKALNLLVFVDLNNPVILFKCDQKFVNDRIRMFMDEQQLPATPSKSTNSERDGFLRMMRNAEPFDKSSVKSGGVKSSESGDLYSQDIIDYTDTLTAWVTK